MVRVVIVMASSETLRRIQPDMVPARRMWSVKETEEMLGISHWMLEDLWRRGILRGPQTKGKRFITELSIRKFLGED